MIQLSHAKLGNLPQVAIHRDVSITKDVVLNVKHGINRQTCNTFSKCFSLLNNVMTGCCWHLISLHQPCLRHSWKEERLVVLSSLSVTIPVYAVAKKPLQQS